MSRRFDAIVVGAGQAAPSLAVRLSDAGFKTALIERERLGGTCVNNGCIPTKTLIASARSAYMARRAGDYGVRIPGPVSVDMAAVKARKDKLVEASRTSLSKWLEGRDNLTIIYGAARFVAPHVLAVGDHVIEAQRIFLNVGGRPNVPDWPGLADVPFLTSTSMMDVDFLPDHLVVVGGSYIGLEFAQMYRRFGSRVTVVEYADRLIAREDVDISDAVLTHLQDEGLAFHLGARDFVASRAGNGTRLEFQSGGESHRVGGSHLLLAIGRRPNTDDLDLDVAGIATDKNGYVIVDDELRTNVEGVWALGDCNGRGAFTHTAYNDYEIVAANLLDGETRRLSDRIPAYALFTDPPLGRIGMSESEVRASGRPALIGKLPMTRVGRAKERGETKGFMKVLVDARSKQILGADFLCADGDEIVQSLLNVMARGAPVTTIQRTMYIHPTISEFLPTLLGNLVPLEAVSA